MMQAFELMNQGKMTGYICQGFNPLAASPGKYKQNLALAKLKFLVVMDPLATETSEFWRNFGEHTTSIPPRSRPRSSVFPPTALRRRKARSPTRPRWLQWHWKGAEPPGERARTCRSMGGIFTRMRKLYQAEGGAFPDPIVNMSWPYVDPNSPSAVELAKEFSGKALKDLADPKDPTKITARPASSWPVLPSCATTARPPAAVGFFCGAWDPPAISWRGATTRSHRHRSESELGLRLAGEPARAVQPGLV